MSNNLLLSNSYCISKLKTKIESHKLNYVKVLSPTVLSFIPVIYSLFCTKRHVTDRTKFE